MRQKRQNRLVGNIVLRQKNYIVEANRKRLRTRRSKEGKSNHYGAEDEERCVFHD